MGLFKIRKKVMLPFIFLLLILAALPAWATTAITNPPNETAQKEPLKIKFEKGIFSIYSEGATLGEVLVEIEKRSGFKISIDEGLKAKPVSINTSGLDITKTLREITTAAGLGGYGISYKSTHTAGKIGQWTVDKITMVNPGDDPEISEKVPPTEKKSENRTDEVANKFKVFGKELFFDKRLNRYVEVAKGDVLVRFSKEITPKEIENFHKENGTRAIKGYEKIGVHLLKIPVTETVQEFIEKHSIDGKQAYVEPVFLSMQQAIIVNDPSFKDQWSIPQIQADKAWVLNNGGTGVTVAIIDTGIDITHSDLKNKVVQGFNIVDGNSTVMDDNGHGTYLAGIIAAEANNSMGIAGISWQSRLMPVKVLNAAGEGKYSDLIEGIIYAVDHGARVLNLSLGGYSYSQFLEDAVQYAHSNRAVIVAAGGNENTNELIYPASYPNVIGVSATDPSDQRWFSSNYGNYIKLSAPGVGVLSTQRDNSYGVATGTSVSTAHVSGVEALILSKNPDLSNTQVENILYQTADDLGDKGWDSYYGFGRVNALKAIEKAGIDVHDNAVTGINIEPETFKIGEAIKIIVKVENQGTFVERNLLVKVSVNGEIIDREQIVLEILPGDNKVVTYNWLPQIDGKEFAVQAEVKVVEGERDVIDNKLVRAFIGAEKDGVVRIKHKSEPWMQTHQFMAGEAAKIWPGLEGSQENSYLNWDTFFAGGHHEIWDYIGAKVTYLTTKSEVGVDPASFVVSYGGRFSDAIVTNFNFDPSDLPCSDPRNSSLICSLAGYYNSKPLPYSEFNYDKFNDQDITTGEVEGDAFANLTAGPRYNGGDDIIEGVHEEDVFDPINYHNHSDIFYNPSSITSCILTWDDCDLDGAFMFAEHLWKPDVYNADTRTGNQKDAGIFDRGLTSEEMGGIYYYLGYPFADHHLGTHRSAYSKAQQYWDKAVIPFYSGNFPEDSFIIQDKRIRDIDLSYYYLGRSLHLLEDMSSVPHVHNELHGLPGYGNNYEDENGVVHEDLNNNNVIDLEDRGYTVWSSYEWAMSKSNKENNYDKPIDYNNISKKIIDEWYCHSPLAIQTLECENVPTPNPAQNPARWPKWRSREEAKDAFYKMPPLFRIFYSMAETTDDFPADMEAGDIIQDPQSFGCLAYHDIPRNIDDNPPLFSNCRRGDHPINTYYKDANKKLKNLDGNEIDGTGMHYNVEEFSRYIQPIALRHIAGFYKLFWDETHPIAVGQGASTNEIKQKFDDAYNIESIKKSYEQTGLEGSGIKWRPVNEVHDWNNYQVQDFPPNVPGFGQSIMIYNPEMDKVFVVHGDIWKKVYESAGGPNSRLGPPISDETNDSIYGTIQFFKNGYISHKDDGGEWWEAYINDTFIDILSPTQSSPAYVGNISAPRKINIEISVTSPSPIAKENFAVKIGGIAANILSVAKRSVSNNWYMLNIQIPPQSAEGAYDLNVMVLGQSDSETAAIQYTMNSSINVDAVLTLDQSGSMAGSYITSAKNAAGMFVDKMHEGDKVAVVSFSSSAAIKYGLTTISPVLSIFSDNMEGGVGSWTADSPWGQTTSNYHSSTTSWTDSPAGNYSNNTTASLYLPAIDLSSMSNPQLKFWTRYSLESNYDYGRVLVSIDGGVSWNELTKYTGTQNSWGQKIIDISAYSGHSSVKIAFKLTTDHSVNSDGWYLDDVEITTPDTRTAVKNAINTISASGSTSIGAGLQLAQNELTGKGVADHSWAIALMSDGFENTSPFVSVVLPGIVSTKTKVYTVALGTNSDESLLQSIASQTGGQYYLAPSDADLARIYNSLSASIVDEQAMFSETGTAQQGATDEKTVNIDPSLTKSTFSISWSGTGNNLDLTLIDPNGNIINSTTSSPDVTFVSGTNSESYTIANPAAGNWIMRIYGGVITSRSLNISTEALRNKSNWVNTANGDSAPNMESLISKMAIQATTTGIQYSATVTGVTPITLSTYLDKNTYVQNDSIILSMSLNDTQEIRGANVLAQITNPSLQTVSIGLYDDGAHGDGGANDGVYANSYSMTNDRGTYSFLINASGTSTSGFTFNRVGYTSTYVSAVSGTNILIAPVSYDFGTIDVGSSSVSQTFTVSNGGNAGLVVGTITLSGWNLSQFYIQNDECSGKTINPSGTCSMEIVFSPTSNGTKSANLNIPSNDPDAPTLSLSLSGKGNLIVVDTSAPINALFSINSNDIYTASTSVILNMDAIDDIGVSGYFISENSSPPLPNTPGWISITSAINYSDNIPYTLSSGDGTQAIYVWYKDAAENVSVAASDSIVLDRISPATTASPVGMLYNSTKSVTLTCNDDAGSGCDNIFYSIDGTTPTTTSLVYAGPLNISTNTTLKFFAVDEAGNSETEKTEIYIFDTLPPTISVNPVITPINLTSQTITGTVEADAIVYVSTDTVVSDGAATVNGTTWSYSITDLVEGVNNITVTATDAAGNQATVTSSITIDITPPETSITDRPSISTTSTSANFSFTSTEAGITFRCQIDSGGYASCSSPMSYTGLADGSHTFFVTATDPLGNTNPTPASFSWTVDTTTPDITVTPATIPFGNVNIESSSDRTISVRNDGSANLSLGTITNISSPFSNVSDDCTGRVLSPSGGCTVRVRFSPVSVETANGNFNIPSNDPDENPVTISLTGTGTNTERPDITVLPSLDLSFPNISVKVTADQIITVKNDGNANLAILNISSTSTPFSIIAGKDNCSNITLIPGQSCSITVMIAPVESGTFNSSFTIPTNDPDENPVTVNLSGSVTPDTNKPPTKPNLVEPSNGANGMPTSLTLKWVISTDADGDPVTYRFYIGTEPSFAGVSPKIFSSTADEANSAMGMRYSIGIIGLLGIIVFGRMSSNRNRKKIGIFFIVIIMSAGVAGFIFTSCGSGGGRDRNNSNNSDNKSYKSYTMTLQPNTTYYWKVVADDGKGGEAKSDMYSFTTRR